MTAGKKIINLVFAPVILVAAVAFIVVLVKMKKSPPPRIPEVAVPRVNVVESSPSDAVPTVSTYGNIRTYYETSVAGQVGGRIESVSPDFDTGRAVKEGGLLAKIDDADFKTLLAERQSALATALQVLADEETRSRIASEDWLASGRSIDDAPEFTLRKPQLAAASAAVTAAQGNVEKAMLDLERTEIRAPFDAIVQARSVSPGNVVAAGTPLGILISRDKAEVRLPLTPDQVTQLDLPLAFVAGPVAPVTAKLTSPSRPGAEWTAQVTRTEAAVDAQNQVLYVIAEIPHPFESGETFLPVGAFVTAEFPGKLLKDVHRLPDASLVEDAFVWIVDPEGNLRQQPVERLFSKGGSFLARIDPPVAPLPLQVVIQPLSSFREGTAVVIAQPKPEANEP